MPSQESDSTMGQIEIGAAASSSRQDGGKAEGAGKGTGARLRAGWMKSAAGNAVPILYTDVNGWAISEGCIILGRTSALQALTTSAGPMPQTLTNAAGLLGCGISDPEYRWPRDADGNYGVPYSFAPPVDASHRQLAQQAIDHWTQKTSIRFRPKQDEHDYVVFMNNSFCASSVGRRGGSQPIWLAPDCTVGNIIHEMAHTIGLWHEHTRADRDVYVEIVWSNIDPQARPNFVTRVSDGLKLGEYDYNSIMHYPSDGFAIDPSKPTIVTPGGVSIGQRNGLSSGDIAAIAELYS
jgi:Astacin (Peptidase family M12A)